MLALKSAQENKSLETNKKKKKKKKQYTNPLTDPPLSLPAKFPFDLVLSSLSPLLSSRPAPQLAACKRRLHHVQTQQVTAHHHSAAEWRNQPGSPEGLQLFSLHISTTHAVQNHLSVLLWGEITLQRNLHRVLSGQRASRCKAGRTNPEISTVDARLP